MVVGGDKPLGPQPPHWTMPRRPISEDEEMKDVDVEVQENDKGTNRKQAAANGNGELAYDPDQKVEDKRRLRAQYRQLLGEQDEHRGDMANLTIGQILENQKLADKYFEKVKAPQEATLDSKVMLQNAEMGAAMARAMKHDADAFDIDDYITELVKFMGGQADEEVEEDVELDWLRIGQKVYPHSRKAPTMDFMVGPLSIEVKQRKKAIRSRLSKNKQDEVHPQELKAEDIQKSENETTKMVRLVSQKLEEVPEEGVTLFEFVINPRSFAQTIENLFYVSFLVRDGRAAVEPDEERGGLLILQPSIPPAEEEREETQKKQQVFTLTPQTWREAIDLFKIEESLHIPHRDRPREYANEIKNEQFLA